MGITVACIGEVSYVICHVVLFIYREEIDNVLSQTRLITGRLPAVIPAFTFSYALKCSFSFHVHVSLKYMTSILV